MDEHLPTRRRRLGRVDPAIPDQRRRWRCRVMPRATSAKALKSSVRLVSADTDSGAASKAPMSRGAARALEPWWTTYCRVTSSSGSTLGESAVLSSTTGDVDRGRKSPPALSTRSGSVPLVVFESLTVPVVPEGLGPRPFVLLWSISSLGFSRSFAKPRTLRGRFATGSRYPGDTAAAFGVWSLRHAELASDAQSPRPAPPNGS